MAPKNEWCLFGIRVSISSQGSNSQFAYLANKIALFLEKALIKMLWSIWIP
jgi:hypothetical protein